MELEAAGFNASSTGRMSTRRVPGHPRRVQQEQRKSLQKLNEKLRENRLRSSHSTSTPDGISKGHRGYAEPVRVQPHFYNGTTGLNTPTILLVGDVTRDRALSLTGPFWRLETRPVRPGYSHRTDPDRAAPGDHRLAVADACSHCGCVPWPGILRIESRQSGA